MSAATAFAGGALARGLLGAAFAVAAFALVWVVETVPLATEPARAPTAAAPVTTRELHVESTFAVVAWSVTVSGRAVEPYRSDDATWSGTVPAGEVLVTAEPADAADARLHALRSRVGGHELVVWGAGAVTLVVPP